MQKLKSLSFELVEVLGCHIKCLVVFCLHLHSGFQIPLESTFLFTPSESIKQVDHYNRSDRSIHSPKCLALCQNLNVIIYWCSALAWCWGVQWKWNNQIKSNFLPLFLLSSLLWHQQHKTISIAYINSLTSIIFEICLIFHLRFSYVLSRWCMKVGMGGVAK